jgi:hypothetical protein
VAGSETSWTGRIHNVTFDCHRPRELVRFWSKFLGYRTQEGEENWASAVDPAERGPRLLFQVVPEGKVAKNRLHLDVAVTTSAGRGLLRRRAHPLWMSPCVGHRLSGLGSCLRVLGQVVEVWLSVVLFTARRGLGPEQPFPHWFSKSWHVPPPQVFRSSRNCTKRSLTPPGT